MKYRNLLVVEPTHLKNMRSRQIGSFPQGVKIKHLWNHHLGKQFDINSKKKN